MATITDSVIETDPAVADIMADFSSQGPNESFDVLKPDVTNPGVSIYAAVNDHPELPPGTEFAEIGGTSMSSPHTAGSAALIKAVRPDWSPAEIKSALMMTSKTEDVFKVGGTEDADPFDRGSGRVDLTKAAEAGLILDEIFANFQAADQALGGKPEELNLAGLQQSVCVLDCEWTRTFSSTQSSTVNWSMSFTAPLGASMSANPSSFAVAAGADETVEFSMEASGIPFHTWTFAHVTLTPDDGSPELHLPVAAKFPSTISRQVSCLKLTIRSVRTVSRVSSTSNPSPTSPS